MLLRHFTRRAPLAAAASGAILLALLFVAGFAPWLSPQNPFAQNLADRLQPPSSAHWLGTDALGRDILSRLIHGSRITLFIVGTVALAAADGSGPRAGRR